MYLGSIKSNVYHILKCASAQRIKKRNRIRFGNLKDAGKNGYRPCKVCKPN